MEHTLPYSGRVSFDGLDYLNLLIALYIFGMSGYNFSQDPTLITLGLGIVLIFAAAGVVLSTVVLGRNKARRCDYVNPFDQLAAIQNAALFEGYISLEACIEQ